MKTIILSMALFFVANINAQWSYKLITDGFDDPYKVAYTESDGLSYLKLEKSEGKLIFFLKGGYFCDNELLVDFVFSTATENYKASLIGQKSESSEIVFFSWDLMNESADFVAWFKKCSTLKIRINESHCTSNYYTFSMGKSTSALDFMTKE
jgi:hypothetical protein